MRGSALVVIGSGSYLAREFMARNDELPLLSAGHGAVDDPRCYQGAACVVNFAFAPTFDDGPYDTSLDIDLRAARHAVANKLHYVMISSRRVYQRAAAWNATEESAVGGLDWYGRNKLHVERGLQALLGDRLTILRPGNVFGYEPIPGRRRFAAYLQNQLLEHGRIRLTLAPQLRRDLVPVEFFCRVLRAAMLRRIPGIFNVGTGRATACGDAARWLIEGFGSGEIVAEGGGGDDEFQLDCRRLATSFGLACGEGDVERALRDAGRRLAAEKSRHARVG